LQAEQEGFSPASDCASRVLLGQGGVHFWSQQRWLNDFPCVDQHWEDSMACFAPWCHVGQERHLSASCSDGRGAKHCYLV